MLEHRTDGKENDMGVYIPNMEKPKGCRWCPLNHDSICYVIQPYKTDETNGEQCRNDCPLIEIVRCGECDKGEETISGKIRCKLDSLGLVWEKTDFCSYGERRADDNKR